VSDSIKIVTEPTVYLIGKQTIDNGELDRFLADHEVSHWQTDTEVAGEKLVEVAGRLCYMSFAKPRPGGNSAYIDHILEVGHGSVLEHAVYNLVITGVSRSLTHELVRHRAGMGYSQLSQRYVDESDCAFVVPPTLMEEVAEARRMIEVFGCSAASLIREGRCSGRCVAGLQWINSMEQSQGDYAYLSGYLAARDAKPGEDKTERRKAAREAARSVLPNATETKIAVTGNARALRHLLEMRGSLYADAEIRRLAVAIWRVLSADSPNIFGDIRLIAGCESGWLSTDHAKV